jgi:hypothetical protein
MPQLEILDLSNITVTRGPDLPSIVVPTYLKNGSAYDLRVNGSVTPQVFTFVPLANEIWYIDKIVATIVDSGTFTLVNFGSLAALTNGVLLEVKSLGTIYVIQNYKTNMELMSCNHEETISGGGALQTPDSYSGALLFYSPVKISGINDFIRVTIRDNLSALDNITMMVHVRKYI